MQMYLISMFSPYTVLQKRNLLSYHLAIVAHPPPWPLNASALIWKCNLVGGCQAIHASVTTVTYHPCHGSAYSLRPHMCGAHHLGKVMERTCMMSSGSRSRSGAYVLSSSLCNTEHTPESPTGVPGPLTSPVRYQKQEQSRRHLITCHNTAHLF